MDERIKDDKRFLGIPDVARFFSVRLATVHEWIRRGELGPGILFGDRRMFTVTDIRVFEARCALGLVGVGKPRRGRPRKLKHS